MAGSHSRSKSTTVSHSRSKNMAGSNSRSKNMAGSNSRSKNMAGSNSRSKNVAGSHSRSKAQYVFPHPRKLYSAKQKANWNTIFMECGFVFPEAPSGEAETISQVVKPYFMSFLMRAVHLDCMCDISLAKAHL